MTFFEACEESLYEYISKQISSVLKSQINVSANVKLFKGMLHKYRIIMEIYSCNLQHVHTTILVSV